MSKSRFSKIGELYPTRREEVLKGEIKIDQLDISIEVIGMVDKVDGQIKRIKILMPIGLDKKEVF